MPGEEEGHQDARALVSLPPRVPGFVVDRAEKQFTTVEKELYLQHCRRGRPRDVAWGRKRRLIDIIFT